MSFDMENEKVLMTKDNQTIECDVLFTFDSEDTMKSYVGYTDHTFAKNGRKNIYVSSFNPLNPRAELEDIKDSLELEMINEVLVKIDEDSK